MTPNEIKKLLDNEPIVVEPHMAYTQIRMGEAHIKAIRHLLGVIREQREAINSMLVITTYDEKKIINGIIGYEAKIPVEFIEESERALTLSAPYAELVEGK